MPDQPFDLTALVEQSRAARVEVAADQRLPDETRLLFEVQYAQHELFMTLLHSGADLQDAMRIVYNIRQEQPAE